MHGKLIYSLEFVILLCQKVNANRSKAFCIVFTHVLWFNYLVWIVAGVTDSSNNTDELEACGELVQPDLPSGQQN